MNSKSADRTSNREFIAMIRAKLDKSGHGDIKVSRLWIEEDTADYPFLLHVPVGPELTVPLRPFDGTTDDWTAGNVDYQTRQFAEALVNLKHAEKMLRKYAKELRRAARQAIAAAQADGLDLLLTGVGFKPVRACHLACGSWKDTVLHVIGELTVRHTSFYLRPETSALWVEEPEDVEHELQELKEEQRKHQQRVTELEERGCDLEVDAITLDLLEAHGLDASEVLREVYKKQCANIKVQVGGRDTWLTVGSSDGNVTAVIELDEAYWNGEYLWFKEDAAGDNRQGSVGSSLGDLVQHEAFSSRPIVRTENGLVYFDLTEKVLFEADTGCIWPVERVSA